MPCLLEYQIEAGEAAEMTAPIVAIPRQFGKYLAGIAVGMSLAQRRHLGEYLTGLLAAERRTITGIHRPLVRAGAACSLKRFLTDSPWDERQLWQALQGLIREQMGWVPQRSTGYLIVDDSVCAKAGRKMAGAGWHWSQQRGRPTFGHCLVDTHYLVGGVSFPAGVELYRPRGAPGFRTKVEIARALVESFSPLAGTQTVAVFDCWYLCARLVGALRARGFDWVSRAKSNRVIAMGKLRAKLGQWAARIPKQQFAPTWAGGQTYLTFAFRCRMKGLGMVKLVVVRDPAQPRQEPCFLVTNRTDWVAGRIIEAYDRRWEIETFHRDTKQVLGLGQYQTRSDRGLLRHWLLVSCAYALLRLRSVEARRDGQATLTLGQLRHLQLYGSLLEFIAWVRQHPRTAKPEEIYAQLKLAA
jgi:hypothetical protein